MGSRINIRALAALAVCGGWVVADNAHAGFASGVVDYTPGSIAATYQNPLSALGMPSNDTSFGMLTPFNPPFLGSHMVGIGEGGSLVLELGASAPTGQGATIGVHAAVGVEDNDWPNGFAGPVATLFTNPRSAEVRVSDDGDRWHSLGTQPFNIPTNFYSEGVVTPGYQEAPGTRVADFSKPFTQPLSAFNGQNWQQILATLDDSAGGTWLDLTAVPYPVVNFIRFDVQDQDQGMYVDAVAVIPEPGTAGAVVLLTLFVARRR